MVVATAAAVAAAAAAPTRMEDQFVHYVLQRLRSEQHLD